MNRRLAVLAARRAHRELDEAAARVVASDPSHAPACGPGCSFCCHVHVDATRAEVLAVAAHLRNHRSPVELASFVEGLAATVSVVAERDHEQRWSARIPCALLDHSGMCTVHEVRPLRCRMFHSCSVEPCREAFGGTNEPDPVTNLALESACEAVEQAFDRALEAGGLSAAPLRLEEGLLEVLLRDGTD